MKRPEIHDPLLAIWICSAAIIAVLTFIVGCHYGEASFEKLRRAVECFEARLSCEHMRQICVDVSDEYLLSMCEESKDLCHEVERRCAE